jgi:membrane protease YdiL (CAAX protease family)
MTKAVAPANAPAELGTTAPSALAPWGMLLSRSVLFFAFQLALGGLSLLAGHRDALARSAMWWPIVALLANLVSIALLHRVHRAEGRSYRELFRIARATWKADLLGVLGAALIGLPLAALPMAPLAELLFGDAMAPTRMMFLPLPGWALALGFLFPVTIGFAELPTYFGYAMPRLASRLGRPWIAWLVASLFLAVQHCFLPFLPDARFLAWRLLMYLPFALFTGFVLLWRPRLLPYFAVLHVLMDLSAMSVYFTI